jgi:peptidyl-prolyl cis-trans isomerase C
MACIGRGVKVGLSVRTRFAEALRSRVSIAGLARLVRDPLVHFLAAGLLIFFASQAWHDAHDRRVIVVTPERASELSTKYRLQFGSAPSSVQMTQLIDAYVLQEALYREGKAMGLDQGDEIIRRRVSQKVSFLQQDRSLPSAPRADELAAWYGAHLKDYATPVRITYSHLYFSADGVEDAVSRARAAKALVTLRSGGMPGGVDADDFPYQNGFAAQTPTEAGRLFGDTDFTHQLETAPLATWSGPYRSGYGWHLLKVEARAPGATPPFAEVQDRVREDFLHGAQAKANALAMDRLTARYRVVRQDLGGQP